MNTKKVNPEHSTVYLLPILFACAFIPLVVFLKVITLDDISAQYWTGTKTNSDFFSYNKAILIMISAALSITSMVVLMYQGRFRFKSLKQYYIPTGVYALLIIISTALSQFPITAKMGFVDRYEGAYVLISYLVFLLLAMNLFNNEKHISHFIIVLFIFASILGLIGIFQFFGYDIFKSQFGKELILPARYDSMATQLDFTFGKYTIYSTLYNTNFVGSYMAMLFPLALAFYFFVKKNYLKIITGLFACLMFANLIGCRSRTGYAAGFIATIVLLFFIRKKVIEQWKYSLAAFLAVLAVLFGMNAATNGELIGRTLNIVPRLESTVQPSTSPNTAGANTTGTTESTTNNDAVNMAGNTTTSAVYVPAGHPVRIKDIQFAEKKVSVISTTETFVLSLGTNQVNFLDGNMKPLNYTTDSEGYMHFTDEQYKPYRVKYFSDQNLFIMDAGTNRINLYVYPNGFKMVGERGILLDKLVYPETFGFEGNEKFASSRGFIWSRSIPLLKKTLLYGFGPDTFAIKFPQHDYIGKLNAFDTVNQIVDKPHNLYLQIGINTGVVSLIAFLALIAIYLVSCIKIYLKRDFSCIFDIMGIGAFTATIGYLLAGIFNDSLVSVAPVFWIILGVGIGCNYLITHKPALEPIKDKIAATGNNKNIKKKK